MPPGGAKVHLIYNILYIVYCRQHTFTNRFDKYWREIYTTFTYRYRTMIPLSKQWNLSDEHVSKRSQDYTKRIIGLIRRQIAEKMLSLGADKVSSTITTYRLKPLLSLLPNWSNWATNCDLIHRVLQIWISIITSHMKTDLPNKLFALINLS